MYKDLFFIQAEVEYSPANVSVRSKTLITKLVNASSSLEALRKFENHVKQIFKASPRDYLNLKINCITDCI